MLFLRSAGIVVAMLNVIGAIASANFMAFGGWLVALIFMTIDFFKASK